jgi:ferredoxin
MARAERRLRVDWIKCDGYGTCSDMLPELIDVDEWRYPILAPGAVPSELLNDAQRAVDCCPMKALILEKVPPPRA